ncbi:MAG: chorismate mutase [Mycobacterium sp.]
MALLDGIRRFAVGLCASTALGIAPTTATAHGDDANPLLGLVDAAAQRLQTAEPVAANKWLTGGAIDDPPRVEQVLAAVSADATGRGVDSAYVRQIFTDQIDATEAIEYTRFAQWKLDPASASRVAPDLAASRAIIDQLNTEMVVQVALHWTVLHSPDCTGTLDDAKTAVTDARMLDPLYQQALTFSTHSYCAP